ncbi:hypothetical protein FEM48_Zijuj07G0149000 [Ziziphus jujuba var. spinosa]|uniref:Uncharacterized protein n=1 Tax=Ziziphus jujuba var. spinosa TaxID=714518 RepID=A0A978V5A4_ZIZJJ|nr:hypothetical protein FEM48_Zijuj07G0149000 [Ziziphus jujuba var. spinosa]
MTTEIQKALTAVKINLGRNIRKTQSLKGINFSHNKLTGPIPSTLENLIGEIPQQLTNMISLEVLNLSNNRMVGTIPRGKQFNNLRQQTSNKKMILSKYGFGWKIVFTGFECGIVIGISRGYIVLSNEKVALFLTRIGEERLNKML